ncbi:hypothetical protein ACQKNT_25145 [Bacillus cereus]
MNLNEELKTIMRYRWLLSEAYSIGGGEEIEFIRKGNIYIYSMTI